MKLAHPFEWLSESTKKTAFIIMFPVTLVISFIMSNLGNPLKTAAAPGGIVDYELAGTLDAAQRILASWGQTERIYAGLGLGFDFVYIIAYSITIALGAVLVARALTTRIPFLATMGWVIAWTLFIAGIFDGIENYALVQMLIGTPSDGLALLARWCAIPKFTIIGIGLVYVLVGTIATLIERSRQS